MSVSKAVAPQLPYLRRYARALTGSQANGDAFVRATLEALLADSSMIDPAGDVRTSLYGVFQRIWSSAHIEVSADQGVGSLLDQTISARLSSITPTTRQALLLTTLESFSDEQAAHIMRLPAHQIRDLVAQAVADIDQEIATDVLIIEDEPLISMQLEQLVESLGHRVVGTAATHTEALACVADKRPGLILADIQLADGSSGIDAVSDILNLFSVPAIFITAFPERLLTGDRPEPTYLITKPFQEATVKAAISQALFLGSTSNAMLAA